MTEKIIDNTPVIRWVDLATICNHFGYSNEQVGNIARIKSRYAGADTIEFDLGDGATILKKGKGILARYRLKLESSQTVISSTD